ncbi:MAG: pilus assembly protein MshP [Deltaproteobacteria bacterium]|nr:pilus assembly protein MshP [Deltaproteobacteria bacterium]
MRILQRLKNQAGFTLVQAVFILVVLALLGAAMMRLIGVQSSTSIFALQGARAYQAARSGLEWGAAQAGSGAACNGTMSIEGFSVTVSCSSQQFTEGSAPSYLVYRISSMATYGTYGSPDYVQRRLESKVGFP